MELTRTINIMEVIWTPFCLVGLIYAARLMGKSAADLFTLRVRRINSIREYAATTTLILFITLTMIQFVFVLIGVVAMLLPGGTTSAGSYVIGSLFIMVSFGLDCCLLVVERRRQSLLRKIAEIENMEGTE